MQKINTWGLLSSLTLLLITKSYLLSFTLFLLIEVGLCTLTFFYSKLRNNCILNNERSVENLKSCARILNQLVHIRKGGRMMQKLWLLQQNGEQFSEGSSTVDINNQFLIIQLLKGIQQNLEKVHNLQSARLFYWNIQQENIQEYQLAPAFVLQKHYIKTCRIAKYVHKELQLSFTNNFKLKDLFQMFQLRKSIIQSEKLCQRLKNCLEQQIHNSFPSKGPHQFDDENDIASTIGEVFNLTSGAGIEQRQRLISSALQRIAEQTRIAHKQKQQIKPQQMRTYQINSIKQQGVKNESQIKKTLTQGYNKQQFKSSLDALMLKGLREREKMQAQQHERQQEDQQLMKAEVVYEDATKYIKVVDAQKLQANLPEERID